ncbi:MAG TPA: SgcJ/EcaC family oxidoreductase [Longimicrobiales bacterium]|nr:SgcJ/EcaC family oxidoreductase [Longimicrobiales bacterium]
MIHRVLPALLVFAAACTPAAPSLSDDVRATALAEVRATTDSLAAAMNAHDSPRFQAFFALDATFAYVSCTEFLVGGGTFADITAAYDMAHADVTVEMGVVTARILAPDAAVVGIQSRSSDPNASNPILTTNVMHKGEDGRWRVVHQHQSWPDCSPPTAPHPMTSGAGVVDLDTIG